ncbi:conserved Plasmodium protein, unknown function [Plasmodium ovale curtisi]|uniref:Potassium channel n=1 Tax=Plasmodium ovale curtisi TaxID=864141 RepID=A0A1A8W683_PLAOA|nr:conserved Plasmodium protein, unknown function [Plasmodium ovale curtisi]
MRRARILCERLVFVSILVGTAYFFAEFMTMYDARTRYISFCLLILIYTISYILAILPEIINSVKYTLFYKTRKRKIYTYSLKRGLLSKRKVNNKDIKIDNLIDTNFLFINQDFIDTEKWKGWYCLRDITPSSPKTTTAPNAYTFPKNNSTASAPRDITKVIPNTNGYVKKEKDSLWHNQEMVKRSRCNNKEINEHVLQKGGKNKKYIIDSCEEFEKICQKDLRKTMKIKDKIIKYIELNGEKEDVTDEDVTDEDVAEEVVTKRTALTAEEESFRENYNPSSAVKKGKGKIGSFLYDSKYLNIKNEDCTEEKIKFRNSKKKYICLKLNRMFSRKRELKRWKTSYLSGFRSNTNKYTLHSFYDRNKHVQKDTDFSRWHNFFLKCIVNIKVIFVKFCKNTSFLICDLIITLLLLSVWINVHKYFSRNNVDIDTGMFNWNTNNIPHTYKTLEGYIQYMILYDICIKFGLFISANHILSFWFLLNMLNTPFLYLIVSFFTKVTFLRYGWLYLSGPFRFLNFLRIENLLAQSNHHNKVNFPVINLSIQIIVVIYTYACIHLLIEQPCKGNYKLYDYVFSGMQTVTTAAMGRGTCFPFTLQSKIIHTFYIFMTFTYIHYKIRYLKNHMVEEKKIYGKIPNIGSHYFVIIGHIKPIALYIIVSELQIAYNNLEEIIILTSLPVKFYLNIIRLLNKKGSCQISVCLYDLNKPFPLKIKKIISYSSGIFLCNNIINTHHNIANDMETLKRYNEITSLGPFNKYISIFLNSMCNYNILLKRNYRNIICLNDLKMKLFAKTLDDCPGMFLLILLFFINTPQKLKFRHSYILSKYFDNLEQTLQPDLPSVSSSSGDEDTYGEESLGEESPGKESPGKESHEDRRHINLDISRSLKPNSLKRGKIIRRGKFYQMDIGKKGNCTQEEEREKYIKNIFPNDSQNGRKIGSGGRSGGRRILSAFPILQKKKKNDNLNRNFLSHDFDEKLCFNSYNNYLNYIKGIKYNIHKIKLPNIFFNFHFTTIVQYMYMNYNSFVIGIINECNEVKLNPVNFIYTCSDIEFVLLTDKYHILQKIQTLKSVQLDWLNSIESLKVKRKPNVSHRSGGTEEIHNRGNDNGRESNTYKGCGNKPEKTGGGGAFFNPVLGIFKVENYLQAQTIFGLKGGFTERDDNGSPCNNHHHRHRHSDSGGKRGRSEHADFTVLIHWPQSLNTFLKILNKRRKHNVIVLGDQVPSYVYNNSLSRYSICYMQKSPLFIFNLVLAGILVCKKCIIFKNYLKLNSHQNIISYNEKTKSINYFEYMCEHNDSELIIIYNNIQTIFRRRDVCQSFLHRCIEKSAPSDLYADYLEKKLSRGRRQEDNLYHGETQQGETQQGETQQGERRYGGKMRRRNVYLLVELNSALSVQYLNNEVYTNVDYVRRGANRLNMKRAHNLLFLENYKKQIQFFKYGNLLVENIYKKIEHIFVDNYYFYLYFLQFTSASIFIDELMYHLIGYTFPIKNNSLNISTVEAFIKGTYADGKRKLKTDLLLKGIHPKYHSRNFFFLFQKWLRKGAIVIGVYRCNEENNMSIVIPCPQRDFIMHKTDKVYVLQSEYRSAAK